MLSSLDTFAFHMSLQAPKAPKAPKASTNSKVRPSPTIPTKQSTHPKPRFSPANQTPSPSTPLSPPLAPQSPQRLQIPPTSLAFSPFLFFSSSYLPSGAVWDHEAGLAKANSCIAQRGEVAFWMSFGAFTRAIFDGFPPM